MTGHQWVKTCHGIFNKAKILWRIVNILVSFLAHPQLSAKYSPLCHTSAETYLGTHPCFLVLDLGLNIVSVFPVSFKLLNQDWWFSDIDGWKTAS